MVSYKAQRLIIVLTLFISTVFLYGCNGGTSASVSNSTIRFEIRDTTTKAALDSVQIMVSGPDNSNANGAVSILRQLKTDSRGKATADDLPPDRTYRIALAKEGYQAPPATGANSQQQFIPDITAGLLVEQGKTYDVIGYLLRVNSQSTGTIRGYVRNRVTGEPISNATVYTTDSSFTSIIDTTDKSSKPGYYELSNVPSGSNRGLAAVIPGLAQPISSNVTVPANGTIDYDILVDPTSGTLSGTIVAAANENLSPGVYIVQVLRNGTDVIASTSKAIANTTTKSDTYQIANVPVILPGSTATYTVKVVADVAHMSNPAGGVSGVIIRQASQTVEVPSITMTAERGTVLVTLYHPPLTAAMPLYESEPGLSTMAPQATIMVENALVESMFVNEGPTRFYRYRLNNVPVGKRGLIVNFPGHGTGGAAGGLSVDAVKDNEVSVLVSLTEQSSGASARQ